MPCDDVPAPPAAPPAWVATALWQSLIAARGAALQAGKSPQEAQEAARQAALATWPALPATHLSEALAALDGLPVADGFSHPAEDLSPASREEVVACLSYALRYDARGKPTPGTRDTTARLAAEWLADHLARSRFLISRLPPGALHRTG